MNYIHGSNKNEKMNDPSLSNNNDDSSFKTNSNDKIDKRVKKQMNENIDSDSLNEVPSTLIYYFDVISDIIVLFNTKNQAHFIFTILFIVMPILLNLYFKYNISKRLSIFEILTSLFILDTLI